MTCLCSRCLAQMSPRHAFACLVWNRYWLYRLTRTRRTTP